MLTTYHSSLRPVLMAFLLAGLLSLPLVADACQIIYSGRATALNGKITVLSVTSQVVQADKSMSCNGAPSEQVVATVRNRPPLLLEADELYAATQGIDGVALTESGLKKLLLDIPGVRLTADVVQSQAEAECMMDNSVQVRGVSTLTNVHLNNQNITISGQPNQKVNIPNVGTIVFNQQIKSSSQIQVYGIRVTLLNNSQVSNGDVRLAFARAAITTCDR